MAESDKRKWEYTLQDIATASEQSINTVRDHKEKGILLPFNLFNMATWIVNMRQLKRAREDAEKRKRAIKTGEVDEWGEPK